MEISVVIPVYNGLSQLKELNQRLTETLESINGGYEIIYVDDHSPDNSWPLICELTKTENIKALKFSRNFGQHYAITAGLSHASGEWVVIMDCDLQDKPEEIIRLYNKAKEGFDIVFARRAQRKDGFIKTAFSFLFYKVLSILSGVRYDPAIANFGIYARKTIVAVLSMKDSIRFFPSMIKWVGFNSTSLEVMHEKRQEGKSAYNFKRLINLAVDIILSYSDKPIRITVIFGLMIAGISFIYALIILYRYFNNEITVLGYTSVIVAISFFSGLIILILGIIGLYLGKTFEAAKNRPLYVISDKNNFE